MGSTSSGHREIATWETQFNDLLEYKAKHGDCDVPRRRQGKLGPWVSFQRRLYLADSLAQDRIDRLDSISFSWSRKGCGVQWETQFNELEYNARHGDCDVPQKRQGKLGTWVSNQRLMYKHGNLSEDRIGQLNGIGFKWSLKERGPLQWEMRFEELIEYKAKHGSCNVPPKRQGRFGEWIQKQRYRCKMGKLSKDRINCLDGIGFDWTSPVHGHMARKTPIAGELSLWSKMRTKIQSGSCRD